MNLQEEIKANYDKKGHWKHSLVFRYAYANKISLKLSWIVFKRELSKLEEQKPEIPDNWIELIKQGIEKNKSYLTSKL